MKIGLISAYVIFLVINFFIDIVLGSMIVSKKLDYASTGVGAFVVVQNLIRMAFGILFIVMAFKSGFKA
jgi:hypothetical protein